MSDENLEVYYPMRVGKSIDQIRFIVSGLEAEKPGRYFFQEIPGMYRKDFRIIGFSKCDEAGLDINYRRFRNKYVFKGPRIQLHEIGEYGCDVRFFCTSEELAMIQDDFIVLRDALGLEGWQDDHAEKLIMDYSQMKKLMVDLKRQKKISGVLTETELEIAQLEKDGLSNPEMAEKRCVALETIAKHVSNINSKLDIDSGRKNKKSRDQAIEKLIDLGLVR